MTNRKRAEKYRERQTITVGRGVRIALGVDGGFCPCGKIRYPTRTAANRTLKRLASFDREPWALNVYARPSLDGWHVGHSRPRGA